ncbi:CLUMA_CG009228, isoform A [Clunio marinus]|uniref:CLUMA_CG009228, isoform A n=1 Tax=Clunio marinus TaxID=568069 RepID=A0A1J1I6E8_9DIPT|nr:CLUMA_CG009228, isoform A [Clunio marinus]
MIFRHHRQLWNITKSFFHEMKTVTVSQGVVRGCREELPNGKSFLRFSGIPYAKPPINELRFKSPQKLLKFEEDEIDCTKERDACFHKCTLKKEYVGSEDCLNLNIYVPEQTDSNEQLAVMVYIHGGGYKYDSNSKDLYSPEYLLMENVIVVTVNYRLQALGFMWLPKKGIPGNAGLKDQQMALEWIHENISIFNGDPQKICLFGESGGAGSVHLHVLNPKSRKFINNAICQSGTAINDWAFYGQNEETVRTSTKDLYDNCDKVLTTEDRNVWIRNKWRMVIEEESDDAFITESSIKSLMKQAGEINFPIIFGTNNGDGIIVVASIISRNKLKFVNENFISIIPRSLEIESREEAEKVAQQIKKFYLNDNDLSMENVEDFVRLRTDVDYLFAQTIANDLNVRYQPGLKQFLYEFQFDGKLNLQKKGMNWGHLPVAGHADDIFYLFGGSLADKIELDEISRESKMRQLMCKLWTNFAKFNDPTPDHNNPLPFKWTPIDKNEVDFSYLVINDNMKMSRNLNKSRMDFWRKLYRKWNKDYMNAQI